MRSVIVVMLGFLLMNTAGAQPGKLKQVKPASVAIVSVPEEATASPTMMAKWLKAHTGNAVALQQALFNWMATHIAYDVENMNRVSSYRDSAAAMLKTLRTRKGLSTDYAVLYAQICRKAGIPATVVTGYGLQNGIPTGSHDWVVVKNGAQWAITDPTWGAGVVENGRFVPGINWTWFRTAPQVAVKTHMPYDPMWQMLPFPLRHDEQGSQAFAAATKRPVFAYNDTLSNWFRQSRLQRLEYAAARIRRFGGAANPFIMSELDWMDQSIKVLVANQEIEARNRSIDEFNRLSRDYAAIVQLYNEYVDFRNRRFTPEVEDETLRKTIGEIAVRLGAVEKALSGLQGGDDAMKGNIMELQRALAQMRDKVRDEQQFVNKYIKTEKGKRKELLYANGG
nr:transglutaminase domain-containing protein [Chitinophaga polysaccharea]